MGFAEQDRKALLWTERLSPKFTYGNPYAQCGGIRRGALGVIRS